MKKSFLTFATAGLLTLTACEFTPMNSEQGIEPSNKEKAVALLNSIETGDQSAVSYVNPA